MIDIRPEEEPAPGQPGHRNARMMNAHKVRIIDFFLAIKEVDISDGDQYMRTPRHPPALNQHREPDYQEKDDLDSAEKEICPRHFVQQVLPGKNQDKDVNRYQ